MLPTQSKICPKTLKGQSWETVNNIYEIVKRKAERKITARCITKVQ
jgi:hypothetical protein